MSTTRLMILGLVRWLQPVHGYQVRRELLSWQAEEWANIQPGSIYHALRKLTSEGFLEEVSTERVGGRPERTRYRMTDAGSQEFQRLMRHYWWTLVPTVDPFLSAFSFLPGMPHDEALGALRHRGDRLRERARQMREAAAPGGLGSEHKPAFVGWMFELDAERAEVEADWCSRVADRIEAESGSAIWAGEEDMTRGWRRALAEGDTPPQT